MKQWFIVAALVCAFMVPANTVRAKCVNEHAAKDLTQTTTKKVLDALTTNAANTESILQQYVVPHFYWKKMSKTVLGKRKWKEASDDQRSRFVDAFKSLLVRTYKISLKEAAGAGTDFEVEYLPVCGRNLDKRVKVRARVPQGSKKIAVDFKMYNRMYNKDTKKSDGDKWEAYDVYVEGISLLLNYKNEFKRVDIENAIARIQSKNREVQP